MAEKFHLLSRNGLRNRISGLHGPTYFQFYAARVLTHDDIKNLYGLSLTKVLAYTEVMFEENALLERIRATVVVADIGYKEEVDSNFLDKLKQKSKHLPCCVTIDVSQFTDYMKNKKTT